MWKVQGLWLCIQKAKELWFQGIFNLHSDCNKGLAVGLRAPARADWGRGRMVWGGSGSQTSFVLPLYSALSLYPPRSHNRSLPFVSTGTGPSAFCKGVILRLYCVINTLIISQPHFCNTSGCFAAWCQGGCGNGAACYLQAQLRLNGLAPDPRDCPPSMPQLSPASLFVDHRGVVINKQPVWWGGRAGWVLRCLCDV